MNVHSKYTDYKIIDKDRQFDRLEHITDSNRTIIIEYGQLGRIKSEWWYLNNRLHREDGAARIDYYKSGEIKYEGWIINHKYHREDGPAYIAYDKSSKIIYTRFYLNNIEYTYDDFVKRPEYQTNLKLKSINIFD